MLLFLIPPIEVYAQEPSPGDSAMRRKVPVDTVIVTGDSASVKKEPFFKIKGSVTVTGMLSDQKMLNQYIPSNYLRTYVNSEIEIGGLPFSAGYYVTTENTAAHPINNFRVSFQYEKFRQKLNSKMALQIQNQKDNEIMQFKNFDIEKVNKDHKQLNRRLSAPSYKRKLLRSESVLKEAEQDSAVRQTVRYKRALATARKHRENLSKVEYLEKSKSEYEAFKRKAHVKSAAEEINTTSPSGYRRTAKKFGLINNTQELFLSVKKFDLGTFNPEYSTLIMSGANITGVNLEVNPGQLYGAFTWGKVVSNGNNFLPVFRQAESRSLWSVRAGVGRTEKLLVACSVLKGVDESSDIKLDSINHIELPKMNTVVGIDIRYIVSKNVTLGAEYARSANEYTNKEIRNSSADLSSLLENAKYANAWNVYVKGQAFEGRTRYSLQMKSVDPLYYSFGAPFLRRDNLRLETKIDHAVWKRQLTGSVTYRTERNNLYSLRQGSSINNSWVLGVQLRIKNLPYLIASYSPNEQYISARTSQPDLFIRVKYFNVIVGYYHRTKTIVSNSSVGMMKQYSATNMEPGGRFNINQYQAQQSLSFPSITFDVLAMLTYVMPLHAADSGTMVVMGTQLTKGAFKNKLKFIGGYRLQNDHKIEERHIAEAGIICNLVKTVMLQLSGERHFIKSQINPAMQQMSVGRMTLIKTF